MTQWHEFEDRKALDIALATHVASSLQKDIAARGGASAAFSGGSTPRGMLAALSDTPLDWAAVDLTLVDDRWVDADHPDSNARLLAETLLVGGAASARFYPLHTVDVSPDEGAVIAEQRIDGMQRPFSAVVLGMGGDGHTASWFPESANLAELTDTSQPAAVLATDPVTAPHLRVTLTLPAVLDTHLLVLHITGEEKRALLEEASEANYPIARILEQHEQPLHIYWAP